MVECSNKGACDRKLAMCICEENYEGLACERTICLNQCSNNGECITMKQYAADFGREYSTPWDATKQVGCVCDLGWRGRDCSQMECPSGPDVLKGHGNEHGRDCSGRGICDYKTGLCLCFQGFYGGACEYQTILW